MTGPETKAIHHQILQGVVAKTGEVCYLVVPPPEETVRGEVGVEVKVGQLTSAGVIRIQCGDKNIRGFESRFRPTDAETMGQIVLSIAGVLEKHSGVTVEVSDKIHVLPRVGEWSLRSSSK